MVTGHMGKEGRGPWGLSWEGLWEVCWQFSSSASGSIIHRPSVTHAVKLWDGQTLKENWRKLTCILWAKIQAIPLCQHIALCQRVLPKQGALEEPNTNASLNFLLPPKAWDFLESPICDFHNKNTPEQEQMGSCVPTASIFCRQLLRVSPWPWRLLHLSFNYLYKLNGPTPFYRWGSPGQEQLRCWLKFYSG